MLEQDPFASSVPQHLKVKTNKRDRKKQVSYISRVKTYREITYFLYIEADIGDPLASSGKKIKERKQLSYREADMWDAFCSSVLNFNKGGRGSKEKAKLPEISGQK